MYRDVGPHTMRESPTNYILLALFTLAEAVMATWTRIDFGDRKNIRIEKEKKSVSFFEFHEVPWTLCDCSWLIEKKKKKKSVSVYWKKIHEVPCELFVMKWLGNEYFWWCKCHYKIILHWNSFHCIILYKHRWIFVPMFLKHNIFICVTNEKIRKKVGFISASYTQASVLIVLATTCVVVPRHVFLMPQNSGNLYIVQFWPIFIHAHVSLSKAHSNPHNPSTGGGRWCQKRIIKEREYVRLATRIVN